MLAVLWPLRNRFRRPTTLLWTTVAAYSGGRFVMFFWRSDTTGFAFGLNVAQVTSLALLAVALIGLWWARRSRPAGEPLAAAA
jgi:prolipoprotein diacylglyceryltransferase